MTLTTQRVKLNGTIDRFIRPRTLTGWVANSPRIGDGRDIEVTVRRDGRIIGRCGLDHERHDIVDRSNYMVGFKLVCSEDIPNEAVAFGLIEVEARDLSGNEAKVGIYNRVQSTALGALLTSSAPVSLLVMSTIITWLARNPLLSEAAASAFTEFRDKYIDAEATGAKAIVETPKLDEAGAVISRMESLGRDCLLGTVQRRLKIEQLGLFRFTGIGLSALTEATRNRFEGIGDPQFTHLTLDGLGEYYLSDKRYGIAAHTFVYEGEVDCAQFLGKQQKRLKFLARKLIEDIQEGHKIFVIHDLPHEIPHASLMELHYELRQIGPAKLLHICPENATNGRGTVRQAAPDLLVGYVAAFDAVLANPSQEICESWLEVCREAIRIVDEL